MSQDDIQSFRRRAETLLMQAMTAPNDGERRRLIDLAARWHACTLIAARAQMSGEATRKAA
jgi:hypothetical protein